MRLTRSTASLAPKLLLNRWVWRGSGNVLPRLIHLFNKYLLSSVLAAAEQHKHVRPLLRTYLEMMAASSTDWAQIAPG